MPASYDMPIRTNHDAWRAVHEGLNDGLTMREISGRADISYQMVGVYSRMPRPAATRRRLNGHHEGGARCVDCGSGVANSGERPSLRCQRCERRRLAGMRAGRVENLRAWALRHGRVPTVNEGRVILGVSRSIAGDEVLAAFGPDTRSGGQRRKAYRGWPEGAPDVPNEAGLRRMREAGRAAMPTRDRRPSGVLA